MEHVESISKEQLQERLRDPKQRAQVINVLEPTHYHLGMIRGSRRIPVSQLDRRMRELDKAREVITYCAHRECDASRRAAEKLAIYGYDVKAYEGGIKEWSAAGLPTEEWSGPMACETCGNEYDKAFEVTMNGQRHIFDCFECAIQALAPACAHCGCRIIGHGVESEGEFFCCAHCAHEVGETALRDRK
jgi:rhodanese-related sulfurtransferase